MSRLQTFLNARRSPRKLELWTTPARGEAPSLQLGLMVRSTPSIEQAIEYAPLISYAQLLTFVAANAASSLSHSRSKAPRTLPYIIRKSPCLLESGCSEKNATVPIWRPGRVPRTPAPARSTWEGRPLASVAFFAPIEVDVGPCSADDRPWALGLGAERIRVAARCSACV